MAISESAEVAQGGLQWTSTPGWSEVGLLLSPDQVVCGIVSYSASRRASIKGTFDHLPSAFKWHFAMDARYL